MERPILPSRRETFQPVDRLHKSAEFVRCYRRGNRRHSALLSLHFYPGKGSGKSSDLSQARLGITASRKVGKAVIRHRLKRWVREIFRRWPDRHLLAPQDIVAHLKPPAKFSTFPEFRQAFEGLLSQLPRAHQMVDAMDEIP